MMCNSAPCHYKKKIVSFLDHGVTYYIFVTTFCDNITCFEKKSSCFLQIFSTIVFDTIHHYVHVHIFTMMYMFI
jgi:hypothetical protein